MQGIGDNGAAKAFFAGASEHGLAEVGAGDHGTRAGALDGKGEVAAAGGQIQKSGGAPCGNESGGAAAPEEVETAGKKMVGEVVPSRDGREEGMNELGLLQREEATCAAR
jgi:hypothetical protein